MHVTDNVGQAAIWRRASLLLHVLSNMSKTCRLYDPMMMMRSVEQNTMVRQHTGAVLAYQKLLGIIYTVFTKSHLVALVTRWTVWSLCIPDGAIISILDRSCISQSSNQQDVTPVGNFEPQPFESCHVQCHSVHLVDKQETLQGYGLVKHDSNVACCVEQKAARQPSRCTRAVHRKWFKRLGNTWDRHGILMKKIPRVKHCEACRPGQRSS